MWLEWELESQADLSAVQHRPAVDAQRETLTGCEVAWDPGAAKAPARAGSPAGAGGVFPLCLFRFAPVQPLLIILALSCLRPKGKVLQKALWAFP